MPEDELLKDFLQDLENKLASLKVDGRGVVVALPLPEALATRRGSYDYDVVGPFTDTASGVGNANVWIDGGSRLTNDIWEVIAIGLKHNASSAKTGTITLVWDQDDQQTEIVPMVEDVLDPNTYYWYPPTGTRMLAADYSYLWSSKEGIPPVTQNITYRGTIVAPGDGKTGTMLALVRKVKTFGVE